ncbi:MAG: DUF6691 family protein [Granulosicoccus sp.]
MHSNTSTGADQSGSADVVRHNPIATVLLACAAGLLFGIGLVVSGMSNPAKVLNFLDVLGHWDASLAFVMGGAVVTTLLGYPLIQRRGKPVLALRFELPTRQDIDQPLVLGAVLFGLGWGIGGYCPGPAWTSLSALLPGSLVFICSMLAAMWLTSSWIRR